MHTLSWALFPLQAETIKPKTIIAYFTFLISFFLRISRLVLDPYLTRDGALYLKIAETWINKDYLETISTYKVVPPLPIYLMKGLTKYGYSIEVSARSISLFCGTMIPVVGFLIADKLFNNIKASLILSFVLIIHPNLVICSTQPLRENLYLLFLSLSILFVIKGIKNKNSFDIFACGAFVASSAFCRYEAIELIILYPIICIFFFSKKYISIKKSITLFFVFFISLFASSILLLSITDYNYSFVLNIKSYVIEQELDKYD